MDIHDEVFFKPPEKTFGQSIIPILAGDPSAILESLPPLPTEKRRIILSGFPFDEGTKRNNGRVGGERGPDSLRHALKTLNIYPNELMSSRLELLDCGDVENHILKESVPLEEAHKKLVARVKLFASFPQTIPFIAGGSNDQSYCNARGFLESKPKEALQKESFCVINIDAHLDVRDLKPGNLAHSGSPFKLLLNDELWALNAKNHFIEFAAQGSQCSKVHHDFVVSRDGEVHWLEKHIRRSRIAASDKDAEGYRTQGGRYFARMLTRLAREHEHIFVSFDIDSINSCFCPGVSAPSVIGGLTDEEALEIGLAAGRCARVKLMDASEFNPAVEDTRTSRLLAMIFYNFAKGVSERTA